MNFDAVAPFYRLLEYGAFGRNLERARRACLLAFPEPPATALVLGDGDGRFLAAAAEHWPATRFVYVDASRRMLEKARRRCRPHGERIAFHHAEAAAWLEANSGVRCDLAVTHFFFDCFSTREATLLATSIAARLQPQARWLVSEFRTPRTPGRRLQLSAMYAFFRIAAGLETDRLPPVASIMEAAGFRRLATHEFCGTFVFSDLWERIPNPGSLPPAAGAALSAGAPESLPPCQNCGIL